MFCPGCFDELYRGACVPGRPPFLPSKPFLAAALGPADVVGQLGFLHLTKCHNLQEMLQMLESSALVPALEARLRRLAAAWGPAPRPPLRAIPEFAARLQRHRLCTLEVRSREQDLRLGGGEGRASLVAPLGEVALRGGEPAVSVPPVPHAAPSVLRGTEGLAWSPAAHACDTVAVDTDD
eukprot:EG_transcript_20979